MTSDPTTSEPSLAYFSRDECLKLLRQGSVGRLAVVIDGQPHVLPLNYVADEDGVIVFRTADLAAATEAALANVAFEVDEIDLARRQGWSVTVHGFGREITGTLDRDSQRLLRMPVHPWARSQRDRWFKITPKEITGRRLRGTASASPNREDRWSMSYPSRSVCRVGWPPLGLASADHILKVSAVEREVHDIPVGHPSSCPGLSSKAEAHPPTRPVASHAAGACYFGRLSSVLRRVLPL